MTQQNGEQEYVKEIINNGTNYRNIFHCCTPEEGLKTNQICADLLFILIQALYLVHKLNPYCEYNIYPKPTRGPDNARKHFQTGSRHKTYMINESTIYDYIINIILLFNVRGK